MTIIRVVFLVLLGLSGLAAQQPIATAPITVWLPGKSSAVVLDIEGYSIDVNGFQPAGRRYLRAFEPKKNVVISVMLETTRPGGGQDCRQSLEARAKRDVMPHASDRALGIEKRELQLAQQDGMDILQFRIPTIKGQQLDQQNLFACQVKDGFYIDVHISKIKYVPADESLFKHALGAVRVVRYEGSDSLEGWLNGSAAYNARNYSKAIEAYGRSLTLEKTHRSLDQTAWRVLVDNLTMAYGLSGDLKGAKQTVEYGLAEEPRYAMFHYNMACVYAESNDMAGAMKYLRSGFENRANVIEGEKYPDPAKDESFQRFMSKQEFRDFLRSLGGGSR